MTLSFLPPALTTFAPQHFNTHKRERWREREKNSVCVCGDKAYSRLLWGRLRKTAILLREEHFERKREQNWLRSVKCCSWKKKRSVVQPDCRLTCRMQVRRSSYRRGICNCNNQAALKRSTVFVWPFLRLLFVNSAMASSGHICMKLTCLNNHKTFMEKKNSNASVVSVPSLSHSSWKSIKNITLFLLWARWAWQRLQMIWGMNINHWGTETDGDEEFSGFIPPSVRRISFHSHFCQLSTSF